MRPEFTLSEVDGDRGYCRASRRPSASRSWGDNPLAGCDCVHSRGHVMVETGAGVSALAPVAFWVIGNLSYLSNILLVNNMFVKV